MHSRHGGEDPGGRLALIAASPRRALLCPKCRRPLPEFFERPPEETCGFCGTSFSVVAFTPPGPVVRLPQPAAGPEGTALGTTPCVQHPNNASVTNCSRCGVFICELCRIPLEGHDLCPDCFDRLSREGSFAAVETQFFDASSLALTLGILGWLLSCGAFLAGPLAIVFAVKGLRQRRAWREVGGKAGPIVSIVLGVLMTLFSLALIAILFAGAAGFSGAGAKK